MTRVARLKSLALHGYKSFAGKTSFEFGASVTAVVGPNGSGKSNIADAIRWVLGEQSYRSLRGRKTDDMIFVGSEKRARAGMASASILFDNSEGWLPIDYAEVSIGRRAHRDGQNEYLLNGQRVRLRDIQELLGAAGLAERTYTIIGQGLVDSVLSLKPEDRSKLFEEAAGILVHRARREEALRRLDKTQDNLSRVKDILGEIRPRLRSLERQAEQALAQDQVRSELQTALEQWYGHHWHQLQQSLASTRQQAERSAAERESLLSGNQQSARALELVNQKVDRLRRELRQADAERDRQRSARSEAERRQAVANERLHWLEQEERQANRELLELTAKRDDLTQRLLQARLEAQRKQLKLFEPVGNLPATDSMLEHVEQRRNRLSELIQELSDRAQSLAQERAALAAKLETEDDGFVRRLVEAAENGALLGLVGELTENLRVQHGHESAVHAVLDGFEHGVVFRHPAELEAALEWLKPQERLEKLTLLPQSKPRELPALIAPSDEGCLGVAADLVQAAPGYEAAAQLLLGRALIVRDRPAARRVLNELPLDARVVTLAGEVFFPAGHVVVTVNGNRNRHRETMRSQLEETNQELEKVEGERHQLLAQRERAEAEFRAQLSQEVVRAKQDKLQNLQDRLQELAEAIGKLSERMTTNLSEQRSQRADIAAAQDQLLERAGAVSDSKAAHAALEDELTQAEAERAELMASEAGARDRQRLAEDRHTQAQIELARLTERQQDLRRRIEDDFNLVAEDNQQSQGAVDQFAAHSAPGGDELPAPPPAFELLTAQPTLPEGLEAKVERLRRRLRSMGAVSPAARSEFQEVKQRHDFLKQQIEDLTEAEARMKHVIAELDELMAREFQRTFEDVQQAFEQYFVRLFGGGSAKLNLVELDDQLGIEMEIRLPGKRTQGLSMLSGGERSLTAVALIFALLKLSPTPFCVLDEVDAMLDESNVLRFVEILRELSQDTQFLVITHNRQTIQAADVLYGISLGSDNSSEVISLKLDEAAEKLAA